MLYIYVDNYRGFSDTYIPVKDVNFFLGENSTGKTSILSLINLLDAPEFWLRQDFNTAEVQLGTYKDIVSTVSNNDKFFRIGIIENSKPTKKAERNKNQDKTQAFLMTFIADEGLPTIHTYHHVKGNKQTKILFLEQTIKYIKSELKKPVTEENIKGVFRRWLKDGIENGKGFIAIKSNIPFSRKEALGHVGDLIQSIHDEKELEHHTYNLILPDFAQKLLWIAPVRSKPKRTYDGYKVDFSPEGDHIPYIIGKILKLKTFAKKFNPFLEKFGKESGLFESIKIKRFGSDTDAPFELDVVINETPMKISNVGYGVSQALPIIVDLFLKPNNFWFAIQQPEVHLHPKAQAAFGDLIFNMAVSDKKKFFIETHSDFVIDRFRLNYKKSQANSDITSQVLFFERWRNGNRVIPINILPNGNYSESQPKNFRSFFIREELNLLGI